MLESRISADVRTDGIGRRVDGGSEEHKATRVFVAEGPMFVGGLHVWPNCVLCAELVWMVL